MRACCQQHAASPHASFVASRRFPAAGWAGAAGLVDAAGRIGHSAYTTPDPKDAATVRTIDAIVLDGMEMLACRRDKR